MGRMRGDIRRQPSAAVLVAFALGQAATACIPLYKQKELDSGTPPQAGCHGLLQLYEQHQQLAERRHCCWGPLPAVAALGCLIQ